MSSVERSPIHVELDAREGLVGHLAAVDEARQRVDAAHLAHQRRVEADLVQAVEDLARCIGNSPPLFSPCTTVSPGHRYSPFKRLACNYCHFSPKVRASRHSQGKLLPPGFFNPCAVITCPTCQGRGSTACAALIAASFPSNASGNGAVRRVAIDT